jgi:hypothetical protein
MTETPVTVDAAVVPYQGGRAAVAVARGGVRVAAVDVEVGRVVCLAHGLAGCAPCTAEQDRRIKAGVRSAERTMFRRNVEPADVDAAAVAIVDVLISHGVKDVCFEARGGSGEAALRGMMVETAIREALPAGLVVDCLTRLPARTKGGALGDACALLGYPPAKEVPPAARIAHVEHQVEPAAPEAPAVEPPGVDVAPALALRVAGVDPGTKRVAVVIGEGTAAPLRLIASKVFPVKDAKDSAEIGRLVADVLAFLSKYGVERVTVERAVFGQSKAGEGMLPAVVGSLLLSAHLGGELAGAIRAWFAQRPDITIASAPVLTCSSTEWRNAACDAAKVERKMGPKGRPIKRTRGEAYPAVRALFLGQLPGDVDTLDAAGACLWTARTAAKVERVVRAEGTKGPRASKHAKRNAVRAAERAAAGCSCEPGVRGRVVHVEGCPVKVAADAKRSGAMKGNRNRAGTGKVAPNTEPSPVTVAAPDLSPNPVMAMLTTTLSLEELTEVQAAAAEGRRLPVGTIRVPPK